MRQDTNGVRWDGGTVQLEVAYDHERQSLQRTAARRKRLYDVKAVNRKFPVGSWVLRYYPPAAQKKLGSPLVGPQQVVRKATGHTVGIQKDPEAPIIFIHVDDLKICPPPGCPGWTPEPLTARSLCASSHITDSDSSPSVDVSTWNNSNTPSSSDIHLKLDQPIDLTEHILSPFYTREFNYQDCRFHFDCTPFVLSICGVTWIENVCYCCSQVGQTSDSVSHFPLLDIRLAITVLFSATRYPQPLVFNGHCS